MHTDKDSQKVYFTHSAWLPIYLIFCILGSFPVLLIMALVFQITSASNVVLAILAIVGGPLGDIIFRRKFRKVMYFLPGTSIQSIYLWPIISLIIFLLKPL